MTSITSPLACRVIDGLADIADRYDVVLSDVWGVVHNGHEAFPDAVAALTRFRAGGGCVVLITNAPRPHGPIIAQLDALGVSRDAYDAIVTSGDATVALIEARGLDPLYHVGPPRDVALFDELKRKTGLVPPLVGLDEAKHVVCTGLFDDATETPDDYAAMFETMRTRDLDMICANPDVVVHVGDRLIFCGGALAERFESLGGRVLYAGKPHAPIYEVAIKSAATRLARQPAMARVLAIGDAVRTDIAGAHARGIDSLFVASGIHRDEIMRAGAEAIDPAALAALFADIAHKPVAAIGHLVWS